MVSNHPSVLIINSVLNVKNLVGAFNQEKALVGTFSAIIKLQSLRRFVCSSHQQRLVQGARLVPGRGLLSGGGCQGLEEG